MPRQAARPALPTMCEQMAMLVAAAAAFSPRERGEAQMRKWLGSGDVRGMSEQRQLCMMADAMLLTADLLLSQPSASGVTAFDRLAKNCGSVGSGKTALDALRTARFRLLRIEAMQPDGGWLSRDMVSGEALRLVSGSLTPQCRGMAIFGRLAVLADGMCCLAGSVTPLDEAALALAAGHASAKGQNASAGMRWAEAIYGHVVRFGTLDVPGVNRPRDMADQGVHAEDCELLEIANCWVGLRGGAAGPELLARTRQLATLELILSGLVCKVAADEAGGRDLAEACQRVLLVQLETVLRRERSGSVGLSLDAVADAIEIAVKRQGMPPHVRPLFQALRQRVAGAGAKGIDDAGLARLMQVIQGLRAKTVNHGCTEQEALAAAEKVAELLDRYGLSLGELDFRAQPCEGIAVQTNRRRIGPLDSCVPAIAAFFDCRVWAEQAKGTALRYIFFGLRADVAATQYLYELVERCFETETDAFRRGKLYAEMHGERRSATNSFQIGLGSGIARKLKAMQAERDMHRRSASGRDLVPVKAAMVDDEVAKLGLSLRARGASMGKRVLTDAFAAGEDAAQRFEWMPAISKAA